MSKSRNNAAAIETSKNCKVFGRDVVLTDPNQIKYYKTYLRKFICENRFIGEINDDGDYIIDNETKKALVGIEKEIVESNDEVCLALAIFMGKNFNFEVEIALLEDGTKDACLYLNEYAADGSVEPFKTFIARVVYQNDDNFIGKVYKAFHLSDSVKIISETDAPILASKLKKMKEELDVIGEIDDIGSQIYILRTLKMLENAGPVGLKIVNEYKKKAESLKLDTKKKGAYSQLRRALDEIIIQNDGLKKIDLPPEELNKPIKEYTDAIDKVMKVSEQKNVAVAPKIAGKGKENKSQPASAGSSKGGGNKGGSKGKGDKASKPKAKKAKKQEKAKKDEKKKELPGLRYGYDDAPKKSSPAPKSPNNANRDAPPSESRDRGRTAGRQRERERENPPQEDEEDAVSSEALMNIFNVVENEEERVVEEVVVEAVEEEVLSVVPEGTEQEGIQNIDLSGPSTAPEPEIEIEEIHELISVFKEEEME